MQRPLGLQRSGPRRLAAAVLATAALMTACSEWLLPEPNPAQPDLPIVRPFDFASAGRATAIEFDVATPVEATRRPSLTIGYSMSVPTSVSPDERDRTVARMTAPAVQLRLARLGPTPRDIPLRAYVRRVGEPSSDIRPLIGGNAIAAFAMDVDDPARRLATSADRIEVRRGLAFTGAIEEGRYRLDVETTADSPALPRLPSHLVISLDPPHK